VANLLLLEASVDIYFVGVGYRLVQAFVLLRLYFYWLNATQSIHPLRILKLGYWIGYLLCLLYASSGLIWFIGGMLPNETPSHIIHLLCLSSLCIYSISHFIQALMELRLLYSVWYHQKMERMNLKRSQMMRLIALSILLIPPDMDYFQVPYVSIILWLIWSCIALWPWALAGMRLPSEQSMDTLKDQYQRRSIGAIIRRLCGYVGERRKRNTTTSSEKSQYSKYSARDPSYIVAPMAQQSISRAASAYSISSMVHERSLEIHQEEMLNQQGLGLDEHDMQRYNDHVNRSAVSISHYSTVLEQMDAVPEIGARHKRSITMMSVARLLRRNSSSSESSDDSGVSDDESDDSDYFYQVRSAAATQAAIDVVTRAVVEAQDRSAKKSSGHRVTRSSGSCSAFMSSGDAMTLPQDRHAFLQAPPPVAHAHRQRYRRGSASSSTSKIALQIMREAAQHPMPSQRRDMVTKSEASD
jgi:hypothetical protein